MGYKIITDSTIDMDHKMIEELGLTVVPLRFTIDVKTYKDKADLSDMPTETFYAKLREGKMSTTSQINAEEFTRIFEPVLQGGEDVLYIAFSSGLSGTCQSAFIARDELKEKYKKGLLRFDKDKNGNMYAQLRDEKNHYGKKLNIKEQVNEKDLIIASQLNVIKDVLDDIVDTLENIEENISHILMEFHNDRVGLYYSGLSLYLEALQVNDASLRKELIAQSLKSLNDSQAQIIQEFKSDIAFLRSPQFNKIKRKKHDCLVEKMQNIHVCFQTINRIITLKAMIYFDNNQFNSMLMVCNEYQRFIKAIIKPNLGFLIECDPRDDKLINGTWSKRANALLDYKEIQNKLRAIQYKAEGN